MLAVAVVRVVSILARLVPHLPARPVLVRPVRAQLQLLVVRAQLPPGPQELPVLVRLVLEPEVPMQPHSRQSFSAAMVRISPPSEKPMYERVRRSRW